MQLQNAIEPTFRSPLWAVPSLRIILIVTFLTHAVLGQKSPDLHLPL